ncbi:uncharacterized protein LOC117329632 [Pecten maximus]|uniref:uncharacterized protein LOC117329632 n=1 Tax=Pecten maximus TaxID=6579 RepID=UPI0014590409|nr:uncharacterized protein LOC117329632 [Pecten maximus]XP_033743550.1 uncharacterized protein LOC117329632 [Pecten maximus]
MEQSRQRERHRNSPPGAYPGHARPFTSGADKTRERGSRPSSASRSIRSERDRKTETVKPDKKPTVDSRDLSDLRKLLHVAEEVQKIDLTSALHLYKVLMKKTKNDDQMESEEQYLDSLNTRIEQATSGKISRDREELQDQFNALLNEKERLEEANKKLESRCKEYDGFYAHWKQAETEKEKYKTDLKRKENELKEVKIEKTAALTEKNEALTRLSKELGNKLTDNNPAIADLSDPNRALKIAEKYNELYDNEWTDAMEKLDETDKNEKRNTQVLLDILTKCYKFCVELAEKQMKLLEMALVSPMDMERPKQAWELSVKFNVPKSIFKQLKDCRKEMSSQVMENIAQENVADKIGYHANKIPHFVKKCIEVCWFMCVLDPPVVIGKQATLNDTFDTNIYKPYTNSGTIVSYNVWPPLLLHQNGSLLVKGIVQPIKVEKKKRKDHVGLTGMKAIPAVKDRTDYGTTYSLKNNDRFTGNAGYDSYEDVYGRTESVRKNKPFQTETSWRDHTPYLDYSRTTDHDPYTQVATHGSDSHRSHVHDHVEAKRSNIGTYHYESTRPSTNYVQQSVSPERSTFKQNGVTYIQIGDKYLKYEDYKSYLRKLEESYA